MIESSHVEFLKVAIDEAKMGLSEGGIPIGSCLVKDGKVIGRGHNQRVQKGSCVLHAEMDCLENTGRLTAEEYLKCTIYTTLSPCNMCTGMILLYKIPEVVIGENVTFMGAEELLRQYGVKLSLLDSEECKSMMREFIKKKPELWNEDIGERNCK